jgi:hypothetical protein
MSAKSPGNPLSSLLHRADPLADDPGLSPTEVAEMRRLVLARVPEKTPRFWRQLSPAVSVAALLALALGAAWWPSTTDDSAAVPASRGEATLSLDTPSVRTETLEAGNALENRKIQFETPGGTLVVWVLNPNFPS